MMTLKETIQSDITKHMKNGETFERDTLRLVLGAIQSEEKAGKTPVEFSDLQTEAFLNKQVKTRRETAGIYTEAGEPERAAKENREADLLASYLPEPMTEADVTAIVENVIAEYDAPTRKDMSKIMKAVNAEVKGRFDGKTLSGLVASRLS